MNIPQKTDISNFPKDFRDFVEDYQARTGFCFFCKGQAKRLLIYLIRGETKPCHECDGTGMAS